MKKAEQKAKIELEKAVEKAHDDAILSQFDSVEKAKMLREKGEKDIASAKQEVEQSRRECAQLEKKVQLLEQDLHAEKVANDRAVRTASLETRKASAELLQMEAAVDAARSDVDDALAKAATQLAEVVSTAERNEARLENDLAAARQDAENVKSHMASALLALRKEMVQKAEDAVELMEASLAEQAAAAEV